jgi:hypothetical protein
MFSWRRSRHDLVESLGWVGGYPFGNGRAVVLRGVLSRLPHSPREPSVLVALEDEDGVPYLLASPGGGRATATGGPVYARGGELVFDAPVPGEALEALEPDDPLDLRVIVVNGGQAVGESVFSLPRAEPVLRPEAPAMLDVVARHMVLVATLGGRTIERGDLKPMIAKAAAFFALSRAGRERLKGLVKANRHRRFVPTDPPRWHASLFTPGWRVDRRIEGFVAAMVAGEVERREEFHTEEHARLLEALASPRIDTGIRGALVAIAGQIRESAQQRSGALSESLGILGLSDGATPEEIKGAYRRIIRDFHPDRLPHVAPVARRRFEERAKEINAAYARLLKHAAR